jgi:hypothetical protein
MANPKGVQPASHAVHNGRLGRGIPVVVRLRWHWFRCRMRLHRMTVSVRLRRLAITTPSGCRVNRDAKP